MNLRCPSVRNISLFLFPPLLRFLVLTATKFSILFYRVQRQTQAWWSEVKEAVRESVIIFPRLTEAMKSDRLKSQHLGMSRPSCCCCCCLPDPFREMEAWRKTIESQKPGNSPGSGPEVVER